MTIKRKIMTLVMMALLAFLVSQASAQEKSKTPDKNGTEKHLAMLKERLNLSDTQVSQIQTIFDESTKQDMTEKEKNSGNPDQALKERMDARKATDDKIMNVLNDDQKKEYSKIKQEEKKHTTKRHHRGDQNDQGKSSGSGGNNQKPGR